MGWSRAITNHPYNDKWKRCRKLMQGSMNKDIMKQYFPALEKDSRSYLLQLLDSPDHFFEHTRLCVLLPRPYASSRGLTLNISAGLWAGLSLCSHTVSRSRLLKTK